MKVTYKKLRPDQLRSEIKRMESLKESNCKPCNASRQRYLNYLKAKLEPKNV